MTRKPKATAATTAKKPSTSCRATLVGATAPTSRGSRVAETAAAATMSPAISRYTSGHDQPPPWAGSTQISVMPPRDDHRQPVTEHAERRAEAALGRVEHVGAVGVDDDVLRGREKGDQPGEQREGADRVARRRRGQPPQRRRQGELGDDEPAAAPPEPGRLEAVHERRPQELEGVGQADQAQEADRRQADAGAAEPRLHRLPRERQRQARREAEHGDCGEAVHGGPVVARLGGCAGAGRCGHAAEF